MTQQNPSPLDTSRPGSVSAADVQKETAAARKSANPEPESVRGEDLKKARGLNRDAGHSRNEAGTDQKVEDAKRARKEDAEPFD
jgi:hypothetical protein